MYVFFFPSFRFFPRLILDTFLDQASVSEQQRLRLNLAQVEREKSLLLQERDSLQKKMGSQSSEMVDHARFKEADARFKEAEDKLHQLQTQLAEAYKKNSDNVEKMLAALSGQREAEARATGAVTSRHWQRQKKKSSIFLLEKENEAQKLRDRTADITAQLERLKRELTERDVTLLTMRDEVTSVQARLVEKAKEKSVVFVFCFFDTVVRSRRSGCWKWSKKTACCSSAGSTTKTRRPSVSINRTRSEKIPEYHSKSNR